MPNMKRLLFNSVHFLTRQFGYDLAKRSSFSLGDPSSVAAIAQHLAELLPALSIEVVIDVGANMGQYYDFLRDRVGFTGRVISFEPIPELAQALKERSRADPKWAVHNIALGRQQGTLPLNMSHKTGWSSLLQKAGRDVNEVAASITIERVADVRIQTLQDVFDTIEPGLDPASTYLKLDSQGFDLEIMLGAQALLQRIPALQSELELVAVYEGAPDYLDVLRFLRSKGFAITGLFPIWADKSFRVGEIDAVFRNFFAAGSHSQ